MEKRRGIFSKEEADSAPRKPGVYFIYSNKFIHRVIGKSKIVYIGVARSNLFRRIVGPREALPRFIRLEKNGHKLTFKIIKKCRTKRQAKRLEKRELKKFEEKHLELPCLNHSS